MSKAKTTSAEISILEISTGRMTFALVGKTPLIYNRMTEKAKRDLLLPRRKKNAVERAASLKHDPVEEYRASVLRNVGNSAETRLALLASAFHGAMKSAALDLPGTRKSEIGRLTWVDGVQLSAYGVPKLLMSVVRMNDIARTPDIRTRAIVPEWACLVTVEFVMPNLTEKGIANLVAAAGLIAGVGDWRQEKGSGNFGQFRIVNEDDVDLRRIMAAGGRVPQDAALKNPECYDADTEELLAWYTAEVLNLHGKREAA